MWQPNSYCWCEDITGIPLFVIFTESFVVLITPFRQMMGEYVEDCFLPHPFQPIIQNPLIQCHGADEMHFTNWETNGKIGYVSLCVEQ